MITTSLVDEFSKIIRDISLRREQIKEDYFRAWLASNVPEGQLNIDYLINNVQLVESWSDDRRTVKWHLEFKEEKHG